MSFSFMLRLAALWLICQSLGANPLEDHSWEFFDGGQHRLTIELPNGTPKTQGFHPAKITAINTGSNAVRWNVTITEPIFWKGNFQTNKALSTQIELLPRQSIEREVLFLAGGGNGSSIAIQVIKPSGQSENHSMNWHKGPDETNSGVERPVLVGVHAAQLLNNLPVEKSDIHSLLNSALASGDWRAYTPFIAVVLGPEDWQTMSAAARAALGDWTRMGGNLQFLGDLPTDAPSVDLPGQAARSLGGVFSGSPEDRGTILDFSKLPAVKAAMPTASPAYEATVNGVSNLQAWLEKTHEHLIQERFTVWPMILVLIGFFVMITPVNLFVLAPSRRRYRLFYTIPIISISACALLALAVLVGDGIGGEGRRLIWIESRPGTENRQFISQWQASRSGALFGTSFTTKDAAFISPISVPGGALNLRVGADHVEGSGAWFISRATQSQFLQTARPGRGRIEWTMRDSKAPEAVSTFEFALREVYVRDQDGDWWHAPTLKQGETTVFQPTDQEAVDDATIATFEGLPIRNWMSEMQERKGHFFALTDQPPAIETLTSIRWKDQGVVSGALHTP